ncbi:hypothetical protein [Nocardioides sediminis]|uniref:hypothetical protein n=1 Tax=Nocardioides sediminis TaxID=433648 RepID=UPI000D30911C|nr:hypothetical protein [Nocardioides sediminis]
MGLFRRPPRTARRPPSSPDPVADAVRDLAGVRLHRRYEDVEPVLAELPDYIEVEDRSDVDGFDTVVGLFDEVHAYVDPFDSGLGSVLADQPGIDKVMHEDREVFHVRSRLALEDVRAAVVRAVVEANLRPRPPVPDADEITDERVDALADVAAPLLVAAGFVRRDGDARQRRYFARAGGDGFAQSAAILPGLGVSADGRQMNRLVHVIVGVYVPEAAHPGSRRPARPESIAPGDCTSWLQEWVEPVDGQVAAYVEGVALPWLAATRDRAALAAWATADPGGIDPPAERALHARLCAEWGYLDSAAALVRHIDAERRSLRSDRNYLAARALLDARR